MPLEKKHFFLGMNQDIEDRLLKDGEYRYALNVRSGSAEDADIGAITNARGNTLVTHTLEGGINEVIGAYEDSGGNRIIYFVYNSDNRHQILEYSINSSSISVILISALLNFSSAYPIGHIDLIDDDLLFWTDNYNEPSSVSIKRLKSTPGTPDGYPVPFIRQYLDAIKYPPLYPPLVEYKSISNQEVNNLKGALYQFKYRFVYFGGAKSTWSPISKVALPVYGQYNTEIISVNNAIAITMLVSDESIEIIEIAGRENRGEPNSQIGNLGDFFLIKSINRLDNNLSYTISFDFLNDEIYSSIDLNESNRLYDYVPKKAQAQAYIENRMIYGNILTQYNLEPLSLSAEEFTDETTLLTGQQQGNSIAPTLFVSDYFPSWQVDTIYWTMPDLIVIGNIFTMEWRDISSGAIIHTWVVIADGTNVSTPQELALAFVTLINNTAPWTTDPDFFAFVIDPTSPQSPLDTQFSTWPDDYSIAIHFNPYVAPYDVASAPYGIWYSITEAGGGFPTGFKKGAKHEFGIVYSDEKGRLGAVQVSEESTVFTSNWSETGEAATYVDLEISSKPPIWATKFHIMYSMNQTASRFLQYVIAGKSSANLSAGLIKVSLANLINFNKENTNSILTYSFRSGDRVRFIRNDSGTIFTNFTDIEVLGYDESTGEITIEHSGSSLDTGALIEIYTPKKDIEEKFFFEIGECLSVINPGTINRLHQSRTFDSTSFDQDQSGTIPFRIRLLRGDIYYKFRSMPQNSSLPPSNFNSHLVEDYNYSDFYVSNSSDKGRPGVTDDLYKETRLPATVFVSEVFVPNTSINGLGSFYGYSYPDLPSRAKDYDKIWGSIQKLYVEDKRCNIFQELKVGRALGGESVIFDQSGVPTINKSNEILSDLIYYPGEYGIGTEPGSFAVYGHTKYFTDMKRGSVLSLAGDAIKPISKMYMHNYFTDTFKEIMVKGTSQGATVRNTFFGVYDIKFSEYILSLRHREHPAGIIKAITFTGHVSLGVGGSPSSFCIDSGDISSFSVGDTVQITYINDSGVTTVVEAQIDTITGACLVPVGQFDFSPYTNNQPVTIANLSEHTYNITFHPEIDHDNELYNDFIGINELNVFIYNRVTEGDEIVTTNVEPQIFYDNQLGSVYFEVNGTDIPIDAVNDGDTVTLYDYHFEEYEITTTLAFNSGDERWKTFYSFIPEMMVGSLMDIVTFKNGSLYLHNSNETHNNFYGDQFDSEVHPVSNGEPSARKLYLSMVQESNKAWSADSITNQQGQQSSLIESDFEDIEGDFYAQFLKDENTPIANALIEGDDLRSHELKVEMKNKDTEAVKLFSVGFNWSPSERTNK